MFITHGLFCLLTAGKQRANPLLSSAGIEMWSPLLAKSFRVACRSFNNPALHPQRIFAFEVYEAMAWLQGKLSLAKRKRAHQPLMCSSSGCAPVRKSSYAQSNRARKITQVTAAIWLVPEKQKCKDAFTKAWKVPY
jgi:hypothetical protein